MKKITTMLLLMLLSSMGYSQSCAYDLTFSYPEPSSGITHHASNSITTQYSYLVAGGYDITLKAGNYIVLKPDTLIKGYSEFLARIEDCDSSGRVAGTQDNMILRLTASPNPTNGLLYLTGLPMNEISIFDLLGKNVFYAGYDGIDSTSIDMGNLQQGVYILKVTAKDGTVETHKIIKN